MNTFRILMATTMLFIHAAVPAIANDVICTGAISTELNSDVIVPPLETCTINAKVNGNVRVEGTLIVLSSGRVEGGIEQFGGVVNVQNGQLKGDIKSSGQVELSGARMEGNIIFELPGTLTLSGAQSNIKGNLEFKAPTTVNGAGDIFLDGNAKCELNVTDNHTGNVATTGNKEDCPVTF